MRIVIAPDSFKESMSALEAAQSIARGALEALPDAEVSLVPFSDGGEGFARTVMGAAGGRWVPVEACDALGRPRTSGYALLPDGRAVTDLADSVGLEHVAHGERDVWRSSTRGLGTVLAAVADAGVREVVVGIGGSASNDLGLGLLAALGARVRDASGAQVDPVPANLARVASVDAGPARDRLKGLTVTVACDVTNPLTGPRGATAVFGPQKGVEARDVERLDAELGRVAGLLGGDVTRPGAGAAGGTGFALAEVLGARLRPGTQCVAEVTGLAGLVARADLVVTGEGAVDAQSVDGKVVSGVARLAADAGVPVVVLAGVVRAGAERLLEAGVSRLVQVSDPGLALEENLRRGPQMLAAAVTRELARWRPGAVPVARGAKQP